MTSRDSDERERQPHQGRWEEPPPGREHGLGRAGSDYGASQGRGRGGDYVGSGGEFGSRGDWGRSSSGVTGPASQQGAGMGGGSWGGAQGAAWSSGQQAGSPGGLPGGPYPGGPYASQGGYGTEAYGRGSPYGQGSQGQSVYGQVGHQVPPAVFQHDHDYHQWREEQMRNLDKEYETWRQDRYRKFADEFNTWRASRQSGRPDSSTGGNFGSSDATATPVAGAGDPGGTGGGSDPSSKSK